MKWSTSNKSWYINKGYLFTGIRDSFEIKICDLSPTSKTHVAAICDYCGKEYKTNYGTLIKGRKKTQKDCCQLCAPIKSSEIRTARLKKKHYDQYLSICNSRGYNPIISFEECPNGIEDILFCCPKHGVQKMTFFSFLNGGECRPCSYEKRGKNLRNSTLKITNKIAAVNNNEWLNPEQYIDANSINLKIRCGLCGEIFYTSYTNYVDKSINRCKSCSKKESLGEKRIREYLEKRSIAYQQEKRFDKCRDVKPLPFDFFIPEYNLCIEFDGQQHYSPLRGEGQLKITQAHDRIKNSYCANNGIKLLRIPYTQYNNINYILERILDNKAKEIV